MSYFRPEDGCDIVCKVAPNRLNGMLGKSGMLGRVRWVHPSMSVCVSVCHIPLDGGVADDMTETNLTHNDCDGVKEVFPTRLLEMVLNSEAQGRVGLEDPSMAVCDRCVTIPRACGETIANNPKMSDLRPLDGCDNVCKVAPIR